MDTHQSLPTPSPAPPAVPAPRPIGRPRIYADPLPGAQPTIAQLARQRRRDVERQAYQADPAKYKGRARKRYGALKLARELLRARVAELESLLQMSHPAADANRSACAA